MKNERSHAPPGHLPQLHRATAGDGPPLGGPPPHAQLRLELSGYWSRRINAKDRIVYRVDEEAAIIHIIAREGHYA